jgi:hypothetical protein
MSMNELDILQQALIINEVAQCELGDFPNDQKLRAFDGMNAVRRSAIVSANDAPAIQQSFRTAAFAYSETNKLEGFSDFVFGASRVMDDPDRKAWLMLVLFYVFRDDVLEALNG